MTQNTLGDLNNHLFMQLERLNDEDLDDKELEREIERSKAVTSVANQIISTGSLVIQAEKLKQSRYESTGDDNIPRILEG